jgi:hypothetical protein
MPEDFLPAGGRMPLVKADDLNKMAEAGGYGWKTDRLGNLDIGMYCYIVFAMEDTNGKEADEYAFLALVTDKNDKGMRVHYAKTQVLTGVDDKRFEDRKLEDCQDDVFYPSVEISPRASKSTHSVGSSSAFDPKLIHAMLDADKTVSLWKNCDTECRRILIERAVGKFGTLYESNREIFPASMIGLDPEDLAKQAPIKTLVETEMREMRTDPKFLNGSFGSATGGGLGQIASNCGVVARMIVQSLNPAWRDDKCGCATEIAKLGKSIATLTKLVALMNVQHPEMENSPAGLPAHGTAVQEMPPPLRKRGLR